LKELRARREKAYLERIQPYGVSGPAPFQLREIFHTSKTEFKSRLVYLKNLYLQSIFRTREERLYATSAPLPKREK
jgi:hypothetical protein